MRSLLLKLQIFLAMSCSAAILTTQAFALEKAEEDLIYNSNFGSAATVAEALKAGANPNAVGEDKWPAISLATMRGDEESTKIVQQLVEAGADLNVRDANGETPLMNAIATNNAPLVKYMIEQGADFRAISPKGQTIKAFAEHYGDPTVAALVAEAIRLDDKRIAEGRSPRRFYRMMDDYIYYNCALQYINYNQVTQLYLDKGDLDAALKLREKVGAKIGNAQVELQHNFLMDGRKLEAIVRSVQKMIVEDLDYLATNRHRRKMGVGKQSDLDARCKKLLERWRPSYEQYEPKAESNNGR